MRKCCKLNINYSTLSIVSMHVQSQYSPDSDSCDFSTKHKTPDDQSLQVDLYLNFIVSFLFVVHVHHIYNQIMLSE